MAPTQEIDINLLIGLPLAAAELIETTGLEVVQEINTYGSLVVTKDQNRIVFNNEFDWDDEEEDAVLSGVSTERYRKNNKGEWKMIDQSQHWTLSPENIDRIAQEKLCTLLLLD